MRKYIPQRCFMRILKNKSKINKNKIFFSKNKYVLIKKSIFNKNLQENDFLVDFFK